MAKNDSHPSNTPALPRLQWRTAALLFWPIAVGGLVLDLWSKHAIFKMLYQTQDGKIDLINGFLALIIRENEGAAFSIFLGWTGFLVLISVIALITEVILFFSGVVRHRLVMFAMGCTAGGIAGNLYDRLFNEGRVRDFIDAYVGTHHWPTFNVADTLLCIGVGLIIISNLTSSTDKSVQ